MNYIKRIINKEIEDYLKIAGVLCIEVPDGVTTISLSHSNSSFFGR